MKIALIGSRGIPARYSGFEQFYEQFAVRLAERGHDVTVYNRSHFIKDVKKEYNGVRIVSLPSIPTKHLDTITHTALSTLHSLFQGYDVVYYCIVGNSPLVWLPRLVGAKTLINVDGEDWAREKWSGFAVKYQKWCEKVACKCANVVVADAMGVLERYRELYEHEAVFVPYGANIRTDLRSDSNGSRWTVDSRQWTVDSGARDAGCGMRDAGCGVRDAGCGVRDAGCGMRDVGCGMRDAGCGMRDVGYEMRDVGYEMRDEQGGEPCSEEPLKDDNGPQTTDHRPRTTDHGPRTTDHRPRTTDHRPQTTDHGPQSPPPALAKWELQPDEYIFYVGRFVPENAIDLLVKAFKRLKTDKKLVVVGDAPYADEFKKSLHELAADDERIVFTGYAFGDNYAQLSANAYFYVQPAGIDGTRPALLDQMGFGNCVLVRNSMVNMEVIGDCGCFFDKERLEDSLTEVMQELIDQPETVEKYRAKVTSRIENYYNWEWVTSFYEDLFERILEGKDFMQYGEFVEDGASPLVESR